MRNSPLKAFANDNKKKKKSGKSQQEINRIKNVDEQIESGEAPNPNESMERLNQYLDFIHDRKIV